MQCWLAPKKGHGVVRHVSGSQAVHVPRLMGWLCASGVCGMGMDALCHAHCTMINANSVAGVRPTASGALAPHTNANTRLVLHRSAQSKLTCGQTLRCCARCAKTCRRRRNTRSTPTGAANAAMPKFKVGDRVTVEGFEGPGTVQFVGKGAEVHEKAAGKNRVGVELDAKVGPCAPWPTAPPPTHARVSSACRPRVHTRIPARWLPAVHSAVTMHTCAAAPPCTCMHACGGGVCAL